MKNRTVLLTGASEGIGYELAKIFATKGNKLILVARNRQKLLEVQKQLGQQTEVMIIEQDLSHINAAQQLYHEIKAANLQIDVLVNNAGAGLQGHFHHLPEQEQLRMIQLNITTLTQLTHLCVQDMIPNSYGRIMNIASISSFIATPSMAVYGATKAYVLFFSEALNTELRKKGDFAVTAICPGPTKTSFASNGDMKQLGDIVNLIGVQPEKVAAIAYHSLAKKKILNIPGKRYKFLLVATNFLPRRIIQSIIAAVTLKKQPEGASKVT